MNKVIIYIHDELDGMEIKKNNIRIVMNNIRKKKEERIERERTNIELR